MKRQYILRILFIYSIFMLIGCSTTSKLTKTVDTLDKYSLLKKDIRQYIKKEMDRHNIVGLSIALIDDKNIVLQEGYGYADKRKRIQATSKTLYRTASISKTFTSIAIMKLVEDRKISLDLPVEKYLSHFKFKNYPGDFKKVSIRNILTHHSGIPDVNSAKELSEYELNYEKILDKLNGEYLTAPINTIYNYSSLGIALLAGIIENVSEKNYRSYMKDNFLIPLDMQNSSFQTNTANDFISKSYTENLDEIKSKIYQKVSLPTMGLVSNVEDLSNFLIAINNNGIYHKNRILKQKSLKKMMSIQNENILLDIGKKVGLGWDINEEMFGKKFILYSRIGVLDGYRACIMSIPRLKLSAVILSNTGIDINIIKNMAYKSMQRMWELKTKKRYIATKKLSLKGNSYNIEGIYNTKPFGKIVILKTSDDKYLMKQYDEVVSLEKNKNNSYSVKEDLLSKFFGSPFLGKVFYFKEIDKQKLIIMEDTYGERDIVGIKISPTPLPPSWKNYLGTYRSKMGNVVLVLKYKDGYLERSWKKNGKEIFSEIFKPLNRHEAILQSINNDGRILLKVKADVRGIYILSHLGINFIKEENYD